jgi:hypothetical protein
MIKIEECLCSANYPELMQNALQMSWLRLLVRGFIGGGFSYTISDADWEVINSCCQSEMVVERFSDRNVMSRGVLLRRNLCSVTSFSAIEESRAARDGWSATEGLVLNGRGGALGLTTHPETVIQSVVGVVGMDAVLVNAAILASSYGQPIVIFSRSAWSIYQSGTSTISFSSLSTSLATQITGQTGAGVRIVISDKLVGSTVVVTHSSARYHLTQYQFDGSMWNEVGSVLDNSTPFPLTSTRNISSVAEAVMQFGGVSEATGTTVLRIV